MGELLRAALIAAVTAALVGTFAAAGAAAPRDTALVSRAGGVAGIKGNGDSHLGRVSADGRFVAFASRSSNLVAGAEFDQVYIRDLTTSATTLVSRANGAGGLPGDGLSHQPAISADGRFVAFRSSSANLDPADTDSTRDVFVRDRLLNKTILVSRAAGLNGPKADLDSETPSISADGRYVAFLSDATNLGDGPPSDGARAYVRDLRLGTTTLASRGNGVAGAPAHSGEPTISANGRYVVFSTSAVLSADDTDTDADVYIRDLQLRTTSLVTKPIVGGPFVTGRASAGAPSADGRYIGVAWQSGDASWIYRLDRLTSATALASGVFGVKPTATPHVGSPIAGGAAFAISPDGRFIAFTSDDFLTNDGDRDLTEDVFVRDVLKGTTTLVSRASGAAGAKGNDGSFSPTIAATGRVAFTSLATNLSPADTTVGSWDIYTHDYVPPVVQGPVAAGPDRTAPVISDLRVAIKRRHGALRRLVISYRLSEPAHVRFTLDALRRGRRHHGRCLPGRSTGHRCTRTRRVPGEVTDQGTPGVNVVRAGPQWCARARLGAPRLRLAARATDPAGNRSAAARIVFATTRKR